MIPSVLARQLIAGLGDYLRATFPAGNSVFGGDGTPEIPGMLERFLAMPDQLFKDLPFFDGLRRTAID